MRAQKEAQNGLCGKIFKKLNTNLINLSKLLYNWFMKKICLYSVLIILALSMFVPFALMFLISLSGNENVFTDYKNINLSFLAYKNVFASIPVVKYFLNSLIVAGFATLGQVLISALAGYGFARLKFKGSDTLFFIFILFNNDCFGCRDSRISRSPQM